MKFDFSDQVVLITGASGNLGQAVVAAARAAGAKLALADRDTSANRERFGDDPSVVVVAVDLLDADSVQGMAQAVVARFGRIDVLCNVAGGFTMGDPVHETSQRTWEFMLNLNARAIVYTANAVVPHMLAQGRGKIVNIAARAALQGKRNMGAYIASKSAVIRLTETMADELRTQGINVNCVLPGTIDTPQNRDAMPKADPDKWVSPAQLANVILFLASDAASAVHGAAVPVVGLS
jgi:NAD(P)-dependent dehydrogenase (short-subunit alcohol dehydrogenase family)